jgi:hypothetical protein
LIYLIDQWRYSSIASNSHNSFNTNASTRTAPTASPVCLINIAGEALLTNAPFAEQYDATTTAVQKTIKALLAAAQIKNDVNADVAFDTMYSIAFAGSQWLMTTRMTMALTPAIMKLHKVPKSSNGTLHIKPTRTSSKDQPLLCCLA